MISRFSRRRLLALGAAAIVLPTLSEMHALRRQLWPGYSVARDGPAPVSLLDLALQTPWSRFRLTYSWLDAQGESAHMDPAWLRVSHSYDAGVVVSGLPDPPPGAIAWRVYAHRGDAPPVIIAAGTAVELNTARALQRMDDGVFV